MVDSAGTGGSKETVYDIAYQKYVFDVAMVIVRAVSVAGTVNARVYVADGLLPDTDVSVGTAADDVTVKFEVSGRCTARANVTVTENVADAVVAVLPATGDTNASVGVIGA